MPRSYQGLCDQFTFHFRVIYDRYSLLRFDLRDEWRDVTSLCDKSVWQMLWTRRCAGFVLSGSVRPIYFPFWRVYDSYSSWHSVWRFDLCLHVLRFFVLCDLWSIFYSVICGYVTLWMHHWSSRYSALCLVELLANGPCHLFLGLSFLKSTAGRPSMGFSYTLNCSVPGRGISGLLRGWLFPFLPFRWLVLLFSFFICKPRPVTTLITFSSQFRYRFILSDGAIGKGKGLALQSLSLRLP